MARKQKTDVRQATRTARTVAGNVVRTPAVIADELTGGKSTTLGKKIIKAGRKGVSRVNRGLRTTGTAISNAVSNTSAAGPKQPIQNQTLNKGKKLLDNTGKKFKRLKGESKSAFKQRVGGQTAANEKIRLRQGTVGPDQPRNRVPNNLSSSARDAPRLTPNDRSPKGFEKPPKQPSKLGRFARGAAKGGGLLAAATFAKPLAEQATGAVGEFFTPESGVLKPGSKALRNANDAFTNNNFDSSLRDLITPGPQSDALSERQDFVPEGDSGGFFSTDARSLNPGRTVEELDSPTSLSDGVSTTANDLLTGGAPDEDLEQQGEDVLARDQALIDAARRPDAGGGAGGGGTEGSVRSTGGTDGGRADGRKRLSLKDALAGFQRSDNPLADAAKLQGRLGLTSANNTALQNTLEFEEEQRQNDFDNAIALNTAELDRLKAAGELDDQDLKFIKEENSVFNNEIDRIRGSALDPDEQDAQIFDTAFTQAKKNGYDPTHQSTQTLFTEIMRQVKDSDQGFIGRGIDALPLVGEEGFSFKDVFDGDAPLFNAQTIQRFSIVDGTLRVQQAGKQGLGKTKGTSPIASLDDLPEGVAQALQEMLGASRSNQ